MEEEIKAYLDEQYGPVPIDEDDEEDEPSCGEALFTVGYIIYAGTCLCFLNTLIWFLDS